MNYFTKIVTKNCRHFYKHHYELSVPVDDELLGQLENFGFMEIINFSKFSPKALDAFKIKLEDTIELEGAICGNYVMASVKKTCPRVLSELEETINSWLLLKMVNP